MFAGTVLAHLFGRSGGREGAALQMSGSLTDGFSRAAHRRLWLPAPAPLREPDEEAAG